MYIEELVNGAQRIQLLVNAGREVKGGNLMEIWFCEIRFANFMLFTDNIVLIQACLTASA